MPTPPVAVRVPVAAPAVPETAGANVAAAARATLPTLRVTGTTDAAAGATVPPMACKAPTTVPPPPNVPPVTSTWPGTLPLRMTVPDVSVLRPVNVFAAVRVVVPSPVKERAKAPLMTPLIDRWPQPTPVPLPMVVSAVRVTDLYARRMAVEELFRDEKDVRYGLGSEQTQVTTTARLDRLIPILALAIILLAGLGSSPGGGSDPARRAAATARASAVTWRSAGGCGTGSP
jgi:hypothetical protein